MKTTNLCRRCNRFVRDDQEQHELGHANRDDCIAALREAVAEALTEAERERAAHEVTADALQATIAEALSELETWKARAIGNANGAQAAAYEHAAAVIANHQHTCMTDKHCDFLHSAQDGAAAKLRELAAVARRRG